MTTEKRVPGRTKSKHLLAANEVYPSSFFDSFPFYNLCQVNIEGLQIWKEGCCPHIVWVGVFLRADTVLGIAVKPPNSKLMVQR